MLLFYPILPANPALESCQWQWCYVDESGQQSTGQVDSQGLSDFKESRPGWFESPRNLGLLLPSDEVLRISVEVPGRTANAIKQALPFALEEYITSDIEEAHIAHGKVRPGNRVDCAIIDHERLSCWLGHFNAGGITVGWVLSQAQLLQQGPDVTTVLFAPPNPEQPDSEQVLVVAENQDASVDRRMLVGVLDSLEPGRVRCLGGSLTDLELSQLETAPAIDVVDLPPLHLATEQLASIQRAETANPAAINLLQGAYAVRIEDKGLSTLWRRTAALAGLWLLVATVAMLIQGYWYQHQADKRQAQNFAAYQELFPNDSVPVTATQLQRRLAGKLRPSAGDGQSQSMVDLVLRVSAVLGAQAEVTALRYRERQTSLTVDVLIRSFDELDAIKNRAQQNAIVIEVSDATKEQNRVRARLVGQYL